MFEARVETLISGQIVRYQLLSNGNAISYRDTLERWQTDELFQDFFISLLVESDFVAFRWETPAITNKTVSRPFEFVLVNAPGFVSRSTDHQSYAEYFTDPNENVVYFTNLRKDATLVVPTPQATEDVYGHLASFVRRGPRQQVHELWKTLGETVSLNLSQKPIWVSTAGGGVAWLHVRIDTRPKYYSHGPYARM